MKFSIRDWCFAVSYSKNYEDDYKNYQKKSLPDYPEYFLEDGVDKHSRLSEPAQILCDKWGIDFPIRPIKYGDSFPSDDILLSFVNPIKPLPAKEKWKQIEGFAFGKEWQQILKINRKTVLSIDPRFPIDIILKKIKEYLEVNVYSSDGRIRNNELDHWLIFHQYHIENKKKMDIAVEHFEVPRNPAINQSSDLAWKRIDGAIMKAQNLISQVEEITKNMNSKE